MQNRKATINLLPSSLYTPRPRNHAPLGTAQQLVSGIIIVCSVLPRVLIQPAESRHPPIGDTQSAPFRTVLRYRGRPRPSGEGNLNWSDQAVCRVPSTALCCTEQND